MKIVTGDKYDYFNISEKNSVWYFGLNMAI